MTLSNQQCLQNEIKMQEYYIKTNFFQSKQCTCSIETSWLQSILIITSDERRRQTETVRVEPPAFDGVSEEMVDLYSGAGQVSQAPIETLVSGCGGWVSVTSDGVAVQS